MVASLVNVVNACSDNEVKSKADVLSCVVAESVVLGGVSTVIDKVSRLTVVDSSSVGDVYSNVVVIPSVNVVDSVSPCDVVVDGVFS